jgi:Spy/CpxP family protein refolding chaperone
MNILKKALIAGGCAAVVALGTGNAMAQGRGNFDPAQFRQRMLDDLRDQLAVKDDAEWSAIEPKITKVFDLGREMMGNRMRGNFRRNNNTNNADDNGGQQRRNRMFGEPSAAMEALQKAVDDKAPKEEIKAKLKAVQDENKDKQAKLTAAQEDLRSVLTPRQEAICTLRGLLQ